jgi:hypothetical protein
MATKVQQVPSIQVAIADEKRHISQIWFNWFLQLKRYLDSNLGAGYSGTIVTAKLTALGAQGSMTFVNGILTAQTPAT